MSRTQMTNALLAGAVALSSIGCNQEPGASGGPASSSTAAAPSASTHVAAAPSATAPAPSATAPKPMRTCPDGTSAEGSLAKPCEAKGTTRLMEVTWTGKMTDTGPSFRVVNKSKSEIIYGSISAYFYDKAGKQLELKDASGKPHPKQVCAGKIFDGPMKAGEKAVITFSCVKKEHVPDGTTSVEGEIQTVGFTDATGAADLYWRNNDLVPDVRPKGGVK